MFFTSEAQLKKFILEKCRGAIANAQLEVFSDFDSNINQFYLEFAPAEYIRTNALADSLKASEVYSAGNSVSAEVRFDTPSYQKGAVPLQSGRTGWASWSDEKILDTAMHGSHGGYVGGTAIWDSTMSELGNITSLIERELKKQGL